LHLGLRISDSPGERLKSELAGKNTSRPPFPGGGPPAPVAEDAFNLQEKWVVVKIQVITSGKSSGKKHLQKRREK